MNMYSQIPFNHNDSEAVLEMAEQRLRLAFRELVFSMGAVAAAQNEAIRSQAIKRNVTFWEDFPCYIFIQFSDYGRLPPIPAILEGVWCDRAETQLLIRFYTTRNKPRKRVDNRPWSLIKQIYPRKAGDFPRTGKEYSELVKLDYLFYTGRDK